MLTHYSPDWRKGQAPEAEAKLLSLFADDPEAPFSIHRFVEHGASACGKHPGEWFGPSATARCIQYVNYLDRLIYITTFPLTHANTALLNQSPYLRIHTI